MRASICPIKRVILFIFEVFLYRWQTVANLSHDCVEMALNDFTECCDVLLVLDKLLAYDQLSLDVILHVVQPVLLHAFVQSFK